MSVLDSKVYYFIVSKRNNIIIIKSVKHYILFGKINKS